MDNQNDFFKEIDSLAKRHLDYEKWGFREAARRGQLKSEVSPSIIYRSEVCKIKISFNEWTPPHQTKDFSNDFYYGRLTALDDKDVATKDGKECYCWHGVAKLLHFLDGRPPEYAAKNMFSHDRIKAFSKMVSSSTLEHKLPEWEIRKHAYIWEEYAPRLFEMLDLNNIALWEKYQGYLKSIYDIRGRNPNIIPSLDNVC